MKKSKKADSLIGIVIWIFILSFALIWIISILNYNKDTELSYSDFLYKYVLEWNSQNIITKLDTDSIDQDETFYIYKNNSTKNFEILTWASNEQYKYIDWLWDLADPQVDIWKTFQREFIKRSDILKHTIEPSEIQNLVFHFDATNISWFSTSTGSVATWNDLSWNGLNATASAPYQPTYIPEWINWLPYVQFDWIDDMLSITNDTLINLATSYEEKSIAIVFKSWFDITSFQNIYEQWWTSKWYAIQIDNWHIYAWVWDNIDWDSWNQYKSVDLWEVVPDSVYSIIMIQNSSYWNDTDNNLQVYLNWELISTLSHVDIQKDHNGPIGIWAVNTATNKLSSSSSISSSGNYFIEWWVWELISWNHALSKDEIKWVEHYLNQKWLSWNKSIYYNIENYSIKKIY